MTPINPILLSEVKRRYGYVPVVLQDPLMESDVSSKVSRTSYSFSSNELRLRLKSFLSFVAKNEAKNRKVLLHCYHGYGASNNLALAYKYVKGVETFWYKDTFYSSKKISLKELKGMYFGALAQEKKLIQNKKNRRAQLRALRFKSRRVVGISSKKRVLQKKRI